MRLAAYYEADWKSKQGSTEFDDTAEQRRALIKRVLMPLLGGTHSAPFRVLDASCADGQFAQFLAGLGCGVFAMDIARGAIARAADNFDQQRLLVGAGENLPFTANSFDAIWFGETIAQVFDVHLVLSEFNRVLRQDGRVMITTPYHGLLKNLMLAISFERHFYPENYRIRFFTPASLRNALARNGFALEGWKGFGRAWPLWKSFFAVARKTGPGSPPPHWHGRANPEQYDRYLSTSPFAEGQYAVKR